MARTMTTNDYVSWTHDGWLGGLTALTVAVTIDASSIAADERLVSNWTGHGAAFLLHTQNTTGVSFVVKDADATNRLGHRTASGVLSTSAGVQRVVARWTGSTIDICVDGSFPSTTEWISGTVDELYGISVPVYVGANGSNTVDGTFSEVAIWNKFFTDAEALAYCDGFAPPTIAGGALELYAPLVRDVNERVRGTTVSTFGGSVVAHPRVIHRKRRQVYAGGSGGGSGGGSASAWYYNLQQTVTS